MVILKILGVFVHVLAFLGIESTLSSGCSMILNHSYIHEIIKIYK